MMNSEVRNPKSEIRITRQEDHCRASGYRFGLRASGVGVLLRGFTLIELLLAITVFGIVLLALHAVFFSALQLRNKTTEVLDGAVPVQHALTVLRRDLMNLTAPNGAFCGPLQTTPTNSVVVMGNRGGQPVSPNFSTAVGVVDETLPWSEVQQVTYVLATPTNQSSGLDLLRNVRRNRLPVQDDLPEEQWLLDGVESMSFQFFDGMQWVDVWDSSTAEPAMPAAVRVLLQFVSEPTQRFRPAPIELIVPVTVQVRTNLTSTAEGGEES